MNGVEKPVLIEVKEIKKLFKKDVEQELLVLNNISFTVREGEIVALLGRSGSGKTTLLRIISGLAKPTSGEVLYRNLPIQRPVKGISMVFQHFALLPWLTVLQNVELGLEALGISRKQRRQKALQAIDTIGLDGFETAFPKELSGGMRQRVGIARALVVDPDVLLMDEPFSALDVLTADNLRHDLIDLWTQDQPRKNSILLVTHNIEEAIFLADRAIVFTQTPSVIGGTLEIDLPHPRDSQSPEFRKLVNKIYTMMTATAEEQNKPELINLGYRLPDANVSELTGLIEAIAELQTTHEPIPLPLIADELNLDIDELLSLTQVLNILRFVDEAEGKISLTPSGIQFANADILIRKKIFARHFLAYIPLVKHIYAILNASISNRVSRRHFLNDLKPYLSDSDAYRVLRVVTEWGRYAELFAYNDKTEELNLENPE